MHPKIINVLDLSNGKILSEKNKESFLESIAILRPQIQYAARNKELHQEIDMWDCHKNSYMGIVGWKWSGKWEDSEWKLDEVYMECTEFDSMLNWGSASTEVNRNLFFWSI